jgi:lipoic acid synthetase
LPDGGASHFAATIRAVKALNPEATVEVLVPDFGGRNDALLEVVLAGPQVVNHNLETVPRLYRLVRPKASYRRSLDLLARVKEFSPMSYTKSGIMLGLGERPEEVIQTMKDLREVKCDVVTLGQYLRPSPDHLPVAEYVSPTRFAWYRKKGEELGFSRVIAGPLVRSSFRADEIFGIG